MVVVWLSFDSKVPPSEICVGFHLHGIIPKKVVPHTKKTKKVAPHTKKNEEGGSPHRNVVAAAHPHTPPHPRSDVSDKTDF